MCEQNTLSKLYGDLPQTSSLWHRADRGTTRSARCSNVCLRQTVGLSSRLTPPFSFGKPTDLPGASGLRTPPQDDIVSSCRGCRPCTPVLQGRSSLFSFLNFVAQCVAPCAARDIALAPTSCGSALAAEHRRFPLENRQSRTGPIPHPRLAAARSRRESDSPPDCHSISRRRFATRKPGRGVYECDICRLYLLVS